MDPYIGEIILFGGNFAPKGWATCDGQLLSIQQNTALFSILGTTYGGNGVTNFALPDLRGRVPVHAGTGPGLSTYVEGEVSGSENVTLLGPELAMHSHTVKVSGTGADESVSSPGGNILAGFQGYGPAGSADGSQLGKVTCGPIGGNGPHNNIQPYQCVTYIIAMVGLFPPRS